MLQAPEMSGQSAATEHRVPGAPAQVPESGHWLTSKQAWLLIEQCPGWVGQRLGGQTSPVSVQWPALGHWPTKF